MKEDKDNLDEITRKLEKHKEAFKKWIENPEEYKKEFKDASDVDITPAMELYTSIAESSINILQNPDVVNIFKQISESIDDKLSARIVELMAITMTQSAHNAILYYDDMLKKELNKQFEHIAHHVNLCRADVDGHTAVLDTFRKRIGDVENKLKVSEFVKDNNISTDPK